MYTDKFLILFLLFMFLVPMVQARSLYSEKAYQAKWCAAHNGQMEYRLSDKARVDCLTNDLAVEFDYANKWAECIGQAIYYGRQTKRQGACVLIMEHGDKDIKYLNRLRRAAYRKGVNLRTFTLKPEYICNPAKTPNCPHMMK